MNLEELKQRYGDEYPAAVIIRGVRMNLYSERRFVRCYRAADTKMRTNVSRFMDGSASIALPQLEQEWPTWTHDEQLDFCNSCSWLHEQPDFAEILRFVMRQGASTHQAAVALRVAAHLPRDEAFDVLVQALHATKIGGTSNMAHGIAKTMHPAAEPTLRKHFEAIWRSESLWKDETFVNWIAFDAVTCVAHLIELGAAPCDFEEHVRRLSSHECSRNRDSCRRFLSKHYSWL